jgi:hypothetical protein
MSKRLLGKGSVERGSIVRLGCLKGTGGTFVIEVMVDCTLKCIPERVRDAQVFLPFFVTHKLLKFGKVLKAENVTSNLAKRPWK